MTDKDEIFSKPLNKVDDFKFDRNVAAVFPDMIKRSVPGYENVIIMSGLFAERFAQTGTNLYDLGCSLGATTLAMRERITADDCRIIAVDKSVDMIKRCRELIGEAGSSAVQLELREADIRDIEYSNNSMTVLNYTLQFLPPEDRRPLLQKIYDSMLPGAVLVLSEKVTFEEKQNSDLFIDIYHAWKAHNGYSEMEIRQKRNALENVLIPDTIPQHLQRLEAVGFKRCELWFQCFNFMSMVAFK
ncbi:carboxy-S-adenosyl-L-methionine synthase CmoA [Lentisphaerota bacterium ZTH]|nr:carboxy-S-adenosyl-L-methionine synthase CmoA [Lentisphaerota bacterium]WET07402.1 carboxy-S-adenosyl-L-methionine synthase CmoA [Lentisphaerota bacterium ZTH]